MRHLALWKHDSGKSAITYNVITPHQTSTSENLLSVEELRGDMRGRERKSEWDKAKRRSLSADWAHIIQVSKRKTNSGCFSAGEWTYGIWLHNHNVCHRVLLNNLLMNTISNLSSNLESCTHSLPKCIQKKIPMNVFHSKTTQTVIWWICCKMFKLKWTTIWYMAVSYESSCQGAEKEMLLYCRTSDLGGAFTLARILEGHGSLPI